MNGWSISYILMLLKSLQKRPVLLHEKGLAAGVGFGHIIGLDNQQAGILK